jgi:hypothetical protein
MFTRDSHPARPYCLGWKRVTLTPPARQYSRWWKGIHSTPCRGVWIHPAHQQYWRWKGYTLHVHTAVGATRYILQTHTAGGWKEIHPGSPHCWWCKVIHPAAPARPHCLWCKDISCTSNCLWCKEIHCTSILLVVQRDTYILHIHTAGG